MADTFTGLKLQGELGRFGTTELSDIAGMLALQNNSFYCSAQILFYKDAYIQLPDNRILLYH